MPRCVQSTTNLVWGIPVNPTELLRAIHTHKKVTRTINTLRACHRFGRTIPAYEDVEATTTGVCFDFSGKGLCSLPPELLGLVEEQVRLLTHEEEVPRTLIGRLEPILRESGADPDSGEGWRRLCMCGDRYTSADELERCRKEILSQVVSSETQLFLLRNFGITTAKIATPVKHSLVLLCLPAKNWKKQPTRESSASLPSHPPIPKDEFETFSATLDKLDSPSEVSSPSTTCSSAETEGTSSHEIFDLDISRVPTPVSPLTAGPNDFEDPNILLLDASVEWRFRNQNANMRATRVDAEYLTMTREKTFRFESCVKELVLWRGVKLGRMQLGFEEVRNICDARAVGGYGECGGGNGVCLKRKKLRLDLEMKRGGVDGNRGGGKDVGRKEEGRRREAERRFWKEALTPSFWMLEEVTLEW
ncbi:hypothetical protein RUND412_003468 [Rhizina undulata]